MDTKIKSLFPVLRNRSQEMPYIYLDNAATTLMPQTVIDKVNHYMCFCGANPYRGASMVSEEVTIECERARQLVAQFISAKQHEVIITKGTTDAINLLSDLLELTKEDVVINAIFDHHANFLPWRVKATLHSAPMTELGEVDLVTIDKILQTNKVKLITISHASNVTGIIQPVEQLIRLAQSYNVLVCVDGAQMVGHKKVSMQQLNADFYVFSGHKMFAMKGIGVLYINEKHHQSLPYKRFGGGMVDGVTSDKILYKSAPLGFEPGTPAVEAIYSLAAACHFMLSTGYEAFEIHQQSWNAVFAQRLQNSNFQLLFPDNTNRLPIHTIRHMGKQISYSNLARSLSDAFNVMINDGQQCCGPLYEAFDQKDALRISAQIYNDLNECDMFFDALEQISQFM